MICKNCKTLLKSDDNFCNSCGAKVIRKRLTIKNLFENFSEQFFNYDNKVLRTFINLFKKPEDVIGGYISGTRKKYVNVISYFAIAITLSGLQIFIINKFFPESIDFSIFSTKESEVLSKNAYDFTSEYQSLLMMFTAPLYALISRIIFLKNKKYNYSEHLVIFMYILAQLSIIGVFLQVFSAILGISMGSASIPLFAFQIIYSAFCLKQLYSLSLKGILLKTLLLFLILFILLILYVIIFVIYIKVFHGGLQNFYESQNTLGYIASFSKNWIS